MSGRAGREALCSPAQERVGLENAPLAQARYHCKSSFISSLFQCPELGGLERALGQCKSGQAASSQLLVTCDV